MNDIKLREIELRLERENKRHKVAIESIQADLNYYLKNKKDLE